MARYVAFLRAINVAGHATVKMGDLKEAFSAAGCQGVQSYIQSGNILYEAPASGHAALAKKVRSEVHRLVGGEATVVFRTMRQLETLVGSAPFKGVKAGSDVKRFVAFLAGKPRARPALPLRDSREKLEIRKILGSDVIVVSGKKPNGFHGFPNALVEKELAVPATSRNWNTITRIVDRFGRD